MLFVRDKQKNAIRTGKQNNAIRTYTFGPQKGTSMPVTWTYKLAYVHTDNITP